MAITPVRDDSSRIPPDVSTIEWETWTRELFGTVRGVSRLDNIPSHVLDTMRELVLEAAKPAATTTVGKLTGVGPAIAFVDQAGATHIVTMDYAGQVLAAVEDLWGGLDRMREAARDFLPQVIETADGNFHIAGDTNADTKIDGLALVERYLSGLRTLSPDTGPNERATIEQSIRAFVGQMLRDGYVLVPALEHVPNDILEVGHGPEDYWIRQHTEARAAEWHAQNCVSTLYTLLAKCQPSLDWDAKNTATKSYRTVNDTYRKKLLAEVERVTELRAEVKRTLEDPDLAALAAGIRPGPAPRYYAPLSILEMQHLTSMIHGAPFSIENISSIVVPLIETYDALRELGKRPVDIADMPEDFWAGQAPEHVLPPPKRHGLIDRNAPQSEEWIGWDGTVRPSDVHPTCPVYPDTMITVMFRDHTELAVKEPQCMRWAWTRPYLADADIVAYRIEIPF